MIFIYLLAISVFGIILALIIEHKKTKKSLLQILKSSCTIDSVQFEKDLDISRKHTNTFKKYVYSITHISTQKAAAHQEILFKKIKFFIRKRLHSNEKKESPSEYITKIRSK